MNKPKNLDKFLNSNKGQKIVLNTIKNCLRIQKELDNYRKIKLEDWNQPFDV